MSSGVPKGHEHLQGVVDEERTPGRYILTGSQNFTLAHSISQSLAGRAGMAQLLPLAAVELSSAGLLPADLDEWLFNGGYPALRVSDITPGDWFAGYVTTYLERDVRDLTAVRDLVTFQRFLRLCAARTGQLLNRDSTGNEVDLVRDEAGVLQPVEIKSGQTVAGDMLKGLQKWRAIARSPIGQPWLVFGGDGEYVRQEVQMMGWREMVGRLKDEGNREM